MSFNLQADEFQGQGFVENKGQVVDDNGKIRPDVLFTYETQNARLFFFKDKVVYAFYRFDEEETAESIKKRKEGDIAAAEMLELRIEQQRIDFEFVNAELNPEIIYKAPLARVVNYYYGHCPKGVRNVPVYQEVVYKEIYPHIDIVFKADENGIKYDIVLRPGADLSDVQFNYNGASPLALKNEQLIVENKICNYTEAIPKSYIKESNEAVEVAFKLLDKHSFGFDFKTNQGNPIKNTIVIDPVLNWSTFFENTASGSVSTIRGNNHVDENGNFFMQLNTYTADLPLANPGGTVYFNPNYNPTSGLDIYFAKFNQDRNLIWSTYFGGNNGNQQNYYDHAMDSNDGYLYLCGDTDSDDFPLVNQGGGAYYETYPGSSCGFLSKFDIATGELVHSTYLKSYDNHCLSVDSDGKVAVISFNYDWTVTPDVMNRTGAYNQATHGGDSDIFIYMFDESLNQIWGTFFGGAGYTDAMGLVHDSNDNLFMFSRSNSTTAMIYQNPGGGAYFDNSFQNNYDLGISKFNTSGALVWSTLYGGSGLEGLSYSNIEVNANDDVIITSTTRSTDIFTTDQGGGAYYQSTPPTGLNDGWGGDPGCGIYAKFDNNGVMLHSTYIGVDGESNYIQDQVQGNCEYEYLLFQTKAFPTTSLSGSYNVNTTDPANYNYMIMEMDENFSIRWASYLQVSNNIFERMAIDNNNGRLYVTGLSQLASNTTVNPNNGAYYDDVFDSGTGRAHAIMEFSITPVSVTIDNATVSPSSVCENTATNITLTANGATLGDGSNVHWYTGSCGGTLIGTGNPLVISQTLSSDTDFYVIYDDGCVTSNCETTSITVNSVPTAVAGSNSPVCEGDDINLTETGGDATAWSWSGPDAFSSSDQNPIINTPTTAADGTYTVTVTHANGCTSTDNVDVSINSVPATPFADTDCSGGADNGIITIINPTGSDYQYDIGSGFQSSPSFNSLSNGTYVVTVTDITSGCTSEGNNVDLDCGCANPPSLSWSSISANTCGGNPVTINDISFGGGATEVNLTHDGNGTLDANNFTTSSFEFTYTPDPLDEGNVVSITVTTDNPFGSPCLAASGIYEITVNPTPTLIVGSNSPVCEGEDINLTESGGDATAWSWSGPNAFSSILQNPLNGSVVNADAGLYSVTITDGTGCTATADVNVQVNSTPDATISDPGSFCSDNASTNLSAATNGGTWSGNGITDASLGTFNPETANLGLNTITYEVTVLGCTGTDNIDVVVIETPNPIITASTDFCIDDPVDDLTASISGGTWTGNGITDAANGTFDPSTAGVGTHTITYNVSNAGCVGTESIDINVFATPDVTITDPGNFCLNDNAENLIASPIGGTWSGDGITDASLGTFDPASAGTGNHVITYSVGISGCNDSDNITINVNPNPDASITHPGNFCEDDASLDLTALSPGGIWSGNGITDASNGTFDPSIAGDGISTISYTLTALGCTSIESVDIEVLETPNPSISDVGVLCFDDAAINLIAATSGGVWSGDGISDASAGIFNPSIAGVGSHTISYSVSNGPCAASDQIIIEVIDAGNVSIDALNSVCQYDSPITLTASPSGGVWSGLGITDSENGIFDPSEAQIGDNVITYTVSVGSCGGNDQQTITVIEKADASIMNVNPLCYDDITIQLEAASVGGTWTGLNVTSNGVFNVGDAGPGAHLVNYEISGTCGDYAQQIITVYPNNFVVDYYLSNPSCYGADNGSLAFAVSGGTPPYTYLWEFGSSDTAYISGLTAGEYNFTILDANGCTNNISEILIEEGDRDCLRIPNVFTPNDDGVNDTWIVENIEYYPDAVIKIFNRWGQLLYEGKTGTDPWDGTYDGKSVPTGSYIYVIMPFREMDDIVGIVTVVR